MRVYGTNIYGRKKKYLKWVYYIWNRMHSHSVWFHCWQPLHGYLFKGILQQWRWRMMMMMIMMMKTKLMSEYLFCKTKKEWSLFWVLFICFSQCVVAAAAALLAKDEPIKRISKQKLFVICGWVIYSCQLYWKNSIWLKNKQKKNISHLWK